MGGDVVAGQSVEFGLGGGDFLSAVGDVAGKGKGEIGDLVLKGANCLAGGLILVDAGEAVLEQSSFEVMAGGRIAGGQGNRRERLVDLLIEA